MAQEIVDAPTNEMHTDTFIEVDQLICDDVMVLWYDIIENSRGGC